MPNDTRWHVVCHDCEFEHLFRNESYAGNVAGNHIEICGHDVSVAALAAPAVADGGRPVGMRFLDRRCAECGSTDVAATTPLSPEVDAFRCRSCEHAWEAGRDA